MLPSLKQKMLFGWFFLISFVQLWSSCCKASRKLQISFIYDFDDYSDAKNKENISATRFKTKKELKT